MLLGVIRPFSSHSATSNEDISSLGGLLVFYEGSDRPSPLSALALRHQYRTEGSGDEEDEG